MIKWLYGLLLKEEDGLHKARDRLLSQDEIVSTTRTCRYKPLPNPGYFHGGLQTGEDLRMGDGSLWFHPDDGSKPRRIE